MSFSKEVMSLFGTEYTKSSEVLLVFLLYGVFRTISGPTMVGLKMTGYQNLELKNSIIKLIAIIALDVVLIPYFGATGAAVGTLMATIFVELMRLRQLRTYHALKLFSKEYLWVVVGIFTVGIASYSLSSLTLTTKLFVMLGSIALCCLIFYMSFEEEDRIVQNEIYRHLSRRQAQEGMP